MARWATFDCYGTLIDWNSGIRRELAHLWGEDEADARLHRYHELEPQVEAETPGMTYRNVMRAVLAQLGDVPPGEEDALGRSLPSWEPFPEVPAALAAARDRGWRLAILSNTDPDFIEASRTRLGVQFDETVVASEIGSYKPARSHWEEFFARTGAPIAKVTSTSPRATSTTLCRPASSGSAPSGSTASASRSSRRPIASCPISPASPTRSTSSSRRDGAAAAP